MNLEYLPNEILLNLFEYFSISHLFHAFFGLNTRFNQLLCVQFQQFHLDLRLLSKTQFDQICQNYVPLILDRIISLHLSNDDDTPQQIELFLSHHSKLRQFTRLRSISITYLQSSQTLDQIMLECSYLPSLTHLTFSNCRISMCKNDANRLFNQIWSLENVRYCNLDIWLGYSYFPHPTVISTSLRHLIVPKGTCSFSKLTHLCQHTPNLAYLSINFNDRFSQLELILPILSITRLKICFNGSTNTFEYLLQNMPNLSHLTWKSDGIYVDGYQLEKIIGKHIPNLKTFQFIMSYSSFNDKDRETQLHEILEPYRTKFWINEHQWFVRCHGCSFDEQDQLLRIDLFTLPYPFTSFSVDKNCILAKSTCSYDNEYLTYDRVINLCYESLDFTSLMSTCIRFSNIRHLALPLPFDDQFLSVVSKLDQLISLRVFVDKDKNLDSIESQLQFLLDQTPRLRSLNFGTWSPSRFQVPPMETISVSVRQLNLQGYAYHNTWRCFDNEECAQLCRSPLGKQCETLLIKVKHRRNVLDLINNMPNLQALHVRCEDDIWSEDDYWSSENRVARARRDEIVEWLRPQLPKFCMITIDKFSIYDIQLWIR